MNFRYDPESGVTVEAETGLSMKMTGLSWNGRDRFLLTTQDGGYWFGFEADIRCRPPSSEEVSVRVGLTQVCTWLVHLNSERVVPPAGFTDQQLRSFVTAALKEHYRLHPSWRTTIFDVAFVEQ